MVWHRRICGFTFIALPFLNVSPLLTHHVFLSILDINSVGRVLGFDALEVYPCGVGRLLLGALDGCGIRGIFVGYHDAIYIDGATIGMEYDVGFVLDFVAHLPTVGD